MIFPPYSDVASASDETVRRARHGPGPRAFSTLTAHPALLPQTQTQTTALENRR